jgi:multidrug efflux pump subunit AcrB
MTLGGLALAVGMLVDDATVEVENINRNLGLGKEIERAILDGAQQIAAPAFVSTTAICIVFVPVVFLVEPARSLFVPLAMAVCFAMQASYLLSRTLVPVMARYLLQHEQHDESGEIVHDPNEKLSLFAKVHLFVGHNFEWLRHQYHEMLGFVLDHQALGLAAFGVFYAFSFCLLPLIGMDFFPSVDAGQLKLHIITPKGERIEEAERIFQRIDGSIRKIIPAKDLEGILQNIGLPTSGINLAFGDNITMSNFDGEILISLKEPHSHSTFYYQKEIRKMLRHDYPEVSGFFQAADIVSQILNAGLPAPIDIQVTGKNKVENYKLAEELRTRVAKVPGAVDVLIRQVVNDPQINVDVDRTRAAQLGLTERDVANSMLTSLSSSFQVNPNFWVNPQNGVNYNLAVQTPTYKINTMEDLLQTNLTPAVANTVSPQMLSNVATARRGTTSAIVSHYKIAPVFDVFANIQGRDLGGVTQDVQKIIKELEPKLARGSYLIVRGQANSMNEAFAGLLGGLVFALVLVYLLLVVNFQSWLDPVIILMAIPGAFAGILWGLFATQTTFSVPALMGAIMSVGVASANSILLVTFANEQKEEGFDAKTSALNAGFTRFRPVIMTAAAMIVGMLPMALGLGEGGAQNAPLGRAVIGGLLVATTATLLFVPNIFYLVHSRAERRKKSAEPVK